MNKLSSYALLGLLFICNLAYAQNRNINSLKVLKDITVQCPNLIKSKKANEKIIDTLQVNTIYHGSTYTAFLDSRGGFYILPKSKSTAENSYNGAIQLSIRHFYYNQKTKRSAARRVVKFLETPAPLENPKSIKLKCELQNNVTHTLNIAFEDKAIIIENNTVDPSGLSPMTISHANLIFPPAFIIKEDSEWTKVKKSYSRSGIQLKGKNKKTFKYTESANLSGHSSEASIKDYWKGRMIDLEVLDGERTSPTFGIINYGNNPPMLSGFTLMLASTIRNNKSGSANKVKKSAPLHPAKVKIIIK
ncbi:hypothetical protein PQO03_15920 [Lentisphaera profundi]|uniref:Uncharacterized protein n=1 Tax=Lentisphaera profundi TaxID=1658616 RepID=A0ABY7W2X3_9BACT|nr:hypothetical protein [Lentisphaera profundi]WDE99324.1 hypothetical protein PQO03_15920 [Lentisphaera profundi]